MYIIKNISASDLSMAGKNLARGQSMELDAIPLALRALEEMKAIKISYQEPTPVPQKPKKSKPTVTEPDTTTGGV